MQIKIDIGKTSYLNSFVVDEDTFIHVIDLHSDSTYLIDENYNRLFEVTYNGYLIDTRLSDNKEYVGKFCLVTGDSWVYKPIKSIPGVDSFNLICTDLLNLELRFFEYVIKQMTTQS